MKLLRFLKQLAFSVACYQIGLMSGRWLAGTVPGILSFLVVLVAIVAIWLLVHFLISGDRFGPKTSLLLVEMAWVGSFPAMIAATSQIVKTL